VIVIAAAAYGPGSTPTIIVALPVAADATIIKCEM
jgi:hypothetical protein